MAISRLLYSAQTVKLWLRKGYGNAVTANSIGGEYVYLLPVSTASADETIPQEDMLVMGKLGAVAREQKDIASCKCSLKTYLCTAMVDPVDGAGNNLNEMDAADGVQCNVQGTVANLDYLLTELRSDALAGRPVTIQCKSNNSIAGNAGDKGFEFVGLCSSIGIDASKGAFPTMDLGFDGLGAVEQLDMGGAGNDSDSADTGGAFYMDACTPITSEQVRVWEWLNDDAAGVHIFPVQYGWVNDGTYGVAGDTATGNPLPADTIASAKFSFDMPTESLSKIGGVIEGKSSVVSDPTSYDGNVQKAIHLGGTPYVDADAMIFSKPPYKASLTLDGQSLEDGAGTQQWTVGGVTNYADALPITLELGILNDANSLVVSISSSAAVSTRSVNQNVGDVGASYSMTVEGSDAAFKNGPVTVNALVDTTTALW